MRNSIGLVWLAAGAMPLAAGDASAQTEIQWWHAMTGEGEMLSFPFDSSST